MNKAKRFIAFIFVILFVWLLSWAGNADFEEEVRQDREYYQNVCVEKAWPDYKQTKPCKEK